MHSARPVIRRVSTKLFLLLVLLVAGSVEFASLTRPAGAVHDAPTTKMEKQFPSAPNPELTAQARLRTATPTPTPTPTPLPTLTKCPTSRWLAEGNANDANGLNPGILKNGATFGTGSVGQAFRLDGLAGLTTGDYVEVPINTAVMNSPGPLGSFTWEACVNPTSLADKPVVFSKEAAVTGVNNRAGLQINPNGSLCSYMNAGNCAITSSPGVVVTGQFSKLTMLYNGSTNNLVTYVNGVQVSTVSVGLPYNHSTAPAPFNIGWSPNGSGNTHFPGRIDEVIFASCVVPPNPCGCGPAPSPSPTPPIP